MATLDKRVQVLFSAEQYARLEAEAKARGISVGAAIREGMDWWLERDQAARSDAWNRIFARADALPPAGAIDWEEEKSAFDRDILRESREPMRHAS